MIAIAKKQRGFTLIELMIALVLSLILMAGIIQIFLSSKQTYRFGEALSRMQENGRFAMDALSRDIRMAGYQGCADLSAIPANIIANNPPTTAFNSDSIFGWEYDGSTYTPTVNTIPADISAKVLARTDVFTIQHASDLGVKLTGNMLADNANIQIAANTAGFVADDVLFISDCETVDVFRATSVSTGSGGKVTIAHANSANSSNKLSKPYGTDATVYSFEHNVYFVGNTGRTNSRGQVIYALYRRDIKGNITELVEGVENMQIVYGERASNGNVRYVPANTSGLDKTKIISVRIAILVHSIDPVNNTADNTTYNLVGTNVYPEGGGSVTHAIDKRLRRVFTTTVKLRNRR